MVRKTYTMIMSLTVKTIEASRPKDKPYKLTDGDGLYLFIPPTGKKVWRANYAQNGKQKTITYGKYPELSLADARRMNSERKDCTGKKSIPTFQEMFKSWLPVKVANLKNKKHINQVAETIRKHVLPYIGNMQINAIPRINMVEVIKQLEHIPETASRVAGRIEMIFDFAVDSGVIEMHAASNLSRVIKKTKSKPMPSIPPDEAGELMRAILDYNEPVAKHGLLLVAHTFVRVGELLGMRWDEIHFAKKVWIIPEERMKKSITHVVPLSDEVIKILRELEPITGESELVLESPLRPGHPLSENTLLFALYRLGYRGRMTVHGFRALASSVLNEHSPFKEDVIERQLAHKETDKVRAAYNRAEYLPQRTELMTWWSNWLIAKYNVQCRPPASD